MPNPVQCVWGSEETKKLKNKAGRKRTHETGNRSMNIEKASNVQPLKHQHLPTIVSSKPYVRSQKNSKKNLQRLIRVE
jgi:hypothetical protein